MDHNDDNEVQIKLDGSLGFGDTAYVTVVTKDGVEEKEESFRFPYVLVRQDVMQKYLDHRLITGFKVVREIQESK